MAETEDTIASQKEVLEALSDFFTEDESSRLAIYVIQRFSKKFKIKFNLEKGFNGYLPEDFINDTIERFCSPNGRKWYKHKSFRDTFYGALDSVISNFLSKNATKEFATSRIEEEKIPESSYEYDKSELLSVCREYLEQIGADVDELLIFEDYILKDKKRRELAEELNVDVDTMTKIQNKLNRKIPKLQQYLIDQGYEK